MNLNNIFKRHLQQGRFFDKGKRVVVAVSTGVDSMVLLSLLQRLPETVRPQIVVAHVNHQLRKQSKEEEQFIRHYCSTHHLRLVVYQWAIAEHPTTGIEEAARKIRYHFFNRVMKQEQASVLITAHHKNDLAETMLMKLTRGGQLHQLIGMKEQRDFVDGKLVRPLLDFTKQQLREYAISNHLKWYEDETNYELTVSRNRFRHRIIPLLEAENPNLLDSLSSYHEQLELAVELEDQFAKEQLQRIKDKQGHVNLKQLLQFSLAKERLILLKWLEWSGATNLKQGFIEQLLADINNRHLPQFNCQITPKLILFKNYSELFLKNVNQLPQKAQTSLNSVVKLGRWYPIGNDYQIAVALTKQFFGKTVDYQEMWLAPEQLPLRIRRWQAQDRLPLKNGGHQKISRVLIDQKVPLSERDQQLVIADAKNNIVWAVGRKWGWFTRPNDYLDQWQRLVIGIRDLKRRKE
ncbi:tRNA lysidine(34) synthetase TilS [Limosilactobacillus fastidiosus]|uniref:tRNA(Ile)-lysidine synthase n=1 Tax=Limosilactobacillus fastidiosus TaxID=2759855 RepID=A0A7W3YCT6_9LACO|nr:tRNA lysidine(34) synthetase TilS [Limosilactobacillus fastidiosus]MBB1086565.1 tRNA lysidine(34) synthetase TilS [Limosilactobacillus fastidiosus]MCD7086541.1 tRNA lysidine(34) synthetase TilS [Limosilactobacillus fastidiosus]MCD7115249.1 tRNA lysidine(34) synthetase TilS [Limosilactobacillus fastidiosus]MCD7116906.1 tRNA lysidine(34) synthetase TilS [Limosilactobacillus fastidiosus]